MNTLNLLAAEGSFDIMAYLLDIIVVVFTLILVISSAKKGFINCVFGLLGTIVAIVAAVSFASLLVNMTDGLFGLEAKLNGAFTESFSKLSGFDVIIQENANIEDLINSTEQNMSGILISLVVANFGGGELFVGKTLGEVVGTTMGSYATLLVSGIALFVVIRILFAILKKLFNFITGTGFLGAINKLLGACVGILEALVIASFVVSVCVMFPSAMEFMSTSRILMAIYEYNPLMWLIKFFLTLSL